MGELKVNGSTVAVFENGTVYAGGSTFWGDVIGYYGGGEIQDMRHNTVATYSCGKAQALGWGGADLCFCSGTTIYEGGSSWNGEIGRFTGDLYGACAAATLYFSLYAMHDAPPKNGLDGISIPLVIVLGFVFVMGVIFVWPTLFEVGGWLSAIMIGTQIIAHVIVGIWRIYGEETSFFETLKTTCGWATISSGVLTWAFSGMKFLMLFGFLLTGFLASILSGLIATSIVVVIEKIIYKDALKYAQGITEQSKKHTPNEETWRCRCGTENSSNYGTCKKCGSYRNTKEHQREETRRETERIRKMIMEYDDAQESNTWMCSCGTKNKTEHGQCKRCGTYRGSGKI